MTKDVNNLDNKRKDVISFFFRIFMAIFVIVLVIVIYNSFFNNNVYIDLNDPDLVETKDGFKKVVDFETKVSEKRIDNAKKGKKYIIICSDKKDEYEIEVGNYIYKNLDIDEEIRVFGTIYYDKDGLRISYDYQVESLVDEDDNGIIDIPDGYKEPEPERVPGVDYGDGVIW